MDPIFGGLLSGGMSMLSSMFGANQSQQNTAATIQANKDMLTQQQTYNTQMSNTAYQRAKSDMEAAGLNPMMMASGGMAASTPTASGFAAPTNPSQGAMAGAGHAMEKAISTAMQMKVQNATIDNLVEQNAKIKAETLTENERPLNVKMDTAVKDQVGYKTQAEKERIRAGIPIILNEALTAKNESDMDPTARKLLDQAGMAGRKADQIISPVGNIVSSAKNVVGMTPKRVRTERSYEDGRGSTFEERWSSH